MRELSSSLMLAERNYKPIGLTEEDREKERLAAERGLRQVAPVVGNEDVPCDIVGPVESKARDRSVSFSPTATPAALLGPHAPSPTATSKNCDIASSLLLSLNTYVAVWCVCVQGTRGSDGRLYVLDLVRITPRDLNYEELTKELTKESSESKGDKEGEGACCSRDRCLCLGCPWIAPHTHCPPRCVGVSTVFPAAKLAIGMRLGFLWPL
jgi:hypothetical protein